MVVKQESSLPNEACREGLLQPWIMEMINTDKNGYSCSLCQLAGLGKAAKPVFILFSFFVPPGTSCGAFIQKHASIITIYLSLTHPYTKYFNSLTRQIIQL